MEEKAVTVRNSLSGSAIATIVGLLVGALGISILWATGQEFPFYPPPGIVILLSGACFVGFALWRWTPAVGAFLGLFVAVGFVIEGIVSGTGFDNLAGAAGTGRALGQGVQVVDVFTALVAGMIATRANYRRPVQTR
jgi:hypothetical protein